VLHIAAGFLFPVGLVPVDEAFLAHLYVSSAVTVFGLSGGTAYYAFRLADRAEAETEKLLRNILPEDVVERLRENPDEPIADAFGDASILFSDIQGFVSMSKQLGAERTVPLLNEMMRRFDALCEQVWRREDQDDRRCLYMAVAGLPKAVADHADRLAHMALDMLVEKDAVAERFGVTIRIRIGISSGPVMAGVIGTRKFSYDVWGDAVNLAARLESSGEPERIQVSAETRHALTSFDCEPRGAIEIKGVGPLETWFLGASAYRLSRSSTASG
jgi:adenylate cyclase